MKNLKIRTKLSILLFVVLVGLMLTGGLSLMFMSDINDSSTEIAGNWLPSAILAEEINTAVSDIRTQEFKHIVSQDPQEMAQVNAKLDQLAAEFSDMHQRYSALATSDTDKQLLSEIKSQWDSYLAEGEGMIQLSAENKTSEAVAAMVGSHMQSFDNLTAKCLELVQFNKAGSDEANRQADITYAAAVKMTVIILLVLTLMIIVISVYIIRGITKPVSEIDNVARKIADGELNESIHYESKDELGKLAVNFNKTVSRLRNYVNYIDEISNVLNEVANGNLVFQLTYDYAGEFAKVKLALEHISNSLNQTLTQINQSADQVSSGSEQVSSGSQALAQGATEQASSVEELAATIGEISSQVSMTAQNAADARDQVMKTSEETTHSNQQMQEMINAMNEISHKSDEIGKIIKTIEDIAFQTNILSLNAAVEAARAGEAGKGFAVVADEVRNLANKSAEASKNTASLIEGSIQAIEKGVKIAAATADSLSQVVESTAIVSNTVGQISDAASAQASSIAQVTQGIDQISSVVQTNSATAEESAAASEELSGQAQVLKELVGRFQLKNSEDAWMDSRPAPETAVKKTRTQNVSMSGGKY